MSAAGDSEPSDQRGAATGAAIRARHSACETPRELTADGSDPLPLAKCAPIPLLGTCIYPPVDEITRFREMEATSSERILSDVTSSQANSLPDL